MRPVLVVPLVVTLCATRAAAQPANHGIALESGFSSPAAGGGAMAAAFALTASTWLEGDVDAFARVAWASGPRTGGRAAVPALAGTVGLRLSLGRAPLRPQLLVDAGWARVPSGRVAASHGTLAAGAALEWLPAGELSIAPRLAVRTAGGAPLLELGLSLGGYF